MPGCLSVVEGFQGRVTASPSFLVLNAPDELDAFGEAVDARIERGRRMRRQEALSFREENVAAHRGQITGHPPDALPPIARRLASETFEPRRVALQRSSVRLAARPSGRE
jgi:hypothetical protein